MWQVGPWTMKAYHIAPIGAPPPAQETLRASRDIAAHVLGAAAGHSVGFVGIHDGRRGSFLFVDWWSDEKELNHRGFYATDRRSFAPLDPLDAIACIWDVRLMAFESEMWHRDVLEGGAVERYLGSRLYVTL
ncbi:MAG: hypothetical protein ACXW5U_07215 [Thermoanaerobaculia bacterium]